MGRIILIGCTELTARLPEPLQRFVRRRGLDRALLRRLGF